MNNILAKLTIVGSLVLAASGIWSIALAKFAQPTYDPAESKSKLKAIGRALQIYRQEAGIRPIAEWNTPADAGLPPTMTMLATPGHPWSLNAGSSAFKLTDPPGGSIPNSASDFAQLYLPPGIQLPPDDPYSRFGDTMQARGKKLPIMADLYFGKIPEHKDKGSMRYAIVLRLDGSVEEITYGQGSMAIFSK